MVTLDKNLVLSVARSRDIYETPALNDSLFLHGLAIDSISSLPEYSKVEFLSLAENCLTSVCGISQFANLRFLNISNNGISKIDITLFPRLEQLHACHNILSSFRVMEKNSSLKLLKISNNKFAEFPDVSNLAFLEVLDVSNNQIHEMNFNEFGRIPPTLRQLYLSPNPFIAKIRSYRKTVLENLSHCHSLSYLDDSFVTEEELAIAKFPHDELKIRETFAASRRDELNRRVSDLRELQFMFDEHAYRICQEIHLVEAQEDQN